MLALEEWPHGLLRYDCRRQNNISTGQGFTQPGPVEDAGERQLAACGTSFLRLVFRSTESALVGPLASKRLIIALQFKQQPFRVGADGKLTHPAD